jgi:hypothetical protein
MVSRGTKGEAAFNSLAGRYSHYSPSAGDGSNTFGASYFHKAGMNAAVALTGAYSTCNGCDALYGLGGDLYSTLWDNTAAKSPTVMSVNLQGSLGWANTTGGSFMSLAVGAPLAINMEQANKSRFGLFVTPGFGWGRVSPDGGTSESGTRPMVGAGGSWSSPAGWGLHAGFQKIVIEDGGNSFGAGFTWRM